MATNPLSYMVDPLNSEYFGTYANSDQMANAGGYRDSALTNTLSQLPGSEAFYRQGGLGDDTNGQGIDPQLLQAYLQQMGYSIFDDPTESGGTLRVMNGDQMLGSESYSNQDNAFDLAALLAAGAVTGGVASGYLGGGAAGTAAASGGLTGAYGAGSAAGGYGGLTGGGLLTGNAAAGIGGMAGYGGLGEAGGLMASLGGAGAAGGAVGGGGGFLSSLGSANSLANLGQAAIGLYGQNKAIGAMNDASNQANDFSRYAFDTIRADNKPLVDMRNSVLPQIQGLLSNPSSITSDPGYQFQFAEGQKALNNGAAGRGMTYSGAQGKALTRYGQDYGATKLDQSLKRLTTVAGLGQVGSNSNNNATANYAANGANNALNQGQARGSAYVNMAQIGGNALASLFNQWQFDKINGG